MIAAYPLQWPDSWLRTPSPLRHLNMSRQLTRDRSDVMPELALSGCPTATSGHPRTGRR